MNTNYNHGRKNRKHYQSKETVRFIPAFSRLVLQVISIPLVKCTDFFLRRCSSGTGRKKTKCTHIYHLEEIKNNSIYGVDKKYMTMYTTKSWLKGKIINHYGTQFRVK